MSTLTTIAAPSSGISEFKSGVDALLEKRRYFVEKILPTLVEGKDYFVIKGRKSMGKPLAEKLASLYQLVATFEKDADTMEVFKSIDGLIALKCTLTRDGVTVAEARAGAVLKEHNLCANTTIKICEKRAFVSAIIRATGLSDLFSQDLEDLPESAIQPSGAVMSSDEAETSLADDPHYPYERAEHAGSEEETEEVRETAAPITERQKTFLYDLATQNMEDPERSEYIANLDSMTKEDAKESIRGMLAMAGR